MRRHPAASLVSLLAVSCIAAPIAEDQAETDQISAGNYAWSANKDAWTEYLYAPLVDQMVTTAWDIDEGENGGCAVGLVQDGETIYLNAFGMASNSQPWSYKTVAPVASVSKTITALSLRRLQLDPRAPAEIDIDLADTLSEHLPDSDLDNATLISILGHESGAPTFPEWDAGSLVEQCGGPCDADTMWEISRPRVSWGGMDDSVGANAPVPTYSNVGYTAIGAMIDEYTHDADWVGPTEQGYEAYTWHRVGRHEGNDTDKGQLLTLALAHSWRVDNLEWGVHYAHGYHYNYPHPSRELWDAPPIDGIEGWEGPSGGWVMTIGDLARLIEAVDQNDIVSLGTWMDMTSKSSDYYGAYGQGVIIDNPPLEDEGFQSDPDPSQPDVAWWHGGDVAGHTAVWAYWPELPETRNHETFGVALICNRRGDNDHGSAELFDLAEDIKDLYLGSGILIFSEEEITGLADLEEVDDRDYLLDLTHATIVDPPSFYVPLDQLEERVWISVDAVGTKASLAMVQGPDPNAPNADVTELGTWTFTPGETIHAGVGADTSIAVAGLGDIDLQDVRLSTAFNKHGTALAGAKLGATIDLRQIGHLADDGWTGMCSDLAGEASCKPCSDRVRACLDVTIGYLEGADQ